MGCIDIDVWDATGNRKQVVEVPDDVPVNRIVVILIERLRYPKFDATGGQLLSYKLHHQATRKQLIDDQTLGHAGVKNGDVVRLIPEIVAGGNGQRTERLFISDPGSEGDDRFARFRLINWWEQERLKNAKEPCVNNCLIPLF